MAQTIKLKRTAVAGKVPRLIDLALGEVAINTTDGKMYIKKSVSGVESLVEVTSAQLPTDPTFDSVTLTGAPGPIEWNSDESTVDVPLNSDVTLQMGQETLFYAKATEAISNGDVVMFAGAQGDHLMVSKADMSLPQFEPEYVIGIATQDFALNDFGFVTTFGKVRGLNTAQYTEGDVLYLDPNVSGGLTTTRPTPTDHIIQMCAVTRAHLTEGTFLVRPTHFHDTDEVPEGSNNLYFTDQRVFDAADSRYVNVTGDRMLGNLRISSNSPQLRIDRLDGAGATWQAYSWTSGINIFPNSASTVYFGRDGATTDVSVYNGDLQIGTTTVIDSGRNLTNIQTISLYEGTSKKAELDITSSDNFKITATGGGGAGLLLWGAGSTVPTISPLKEGNSTNGEVNLGRSNEKFNNAWFAGTVTASAFSGALDYNDITNPPIIDNSDDYVSSAGFNTSTGVLTLTRVEGGTVTVDLDGRYYNTTDSNNRYVAKAGDTMTGDLTLGSNRLNLKTGGSSTVPQLLGHRSSVDLDSRLFLNEGGFSYTTFDSDTPNRPGGVSNNANGVLTLNTHNGGYNHQLVFTNQGHIYHRSKESSTLRSWDRVFTDSYHPISWNELSDKPSIDNSVDYINAASFNTGTGVLTLSGVGRAGATVDLDNRYLTSYSETDTLQSVTARGNTTDRTISIQNSNPVLILKDVDSTGSSQLGYISLKDSSDVEKGWMGYGSGANTDLTIKNSLGKVRLDATYTYIPGLDLAISSTNSDHGKGTYFRGSNTHFVLGLQAGNTLYLNYGNESGALRLYGNTYYNNSLMLNSSRDLLSLRNATFSGTVTASAFSGNLDYNDITNPPVIENSVDYINSASFNTSNGVLTLSGVGRAGATVDLDGRYYNTGESDGRYVRNTGDTMTGPLNIVLNAESTRGPTALVLKSTMSDIQGAADTDGSFIEFQSTDSNATYTPQVKIGMLVKDYTGDSGIPSEGTGNFVVYTSQGSGGSGEGSLNERFRVTEDGRLLSNGSERVFTDSYHPISWNDISGKPPIDNSVDYINAASFNTSNGVLTLSGVGRAGATVDLDNRYQLDSAPAAPTITSTLVVGETIEVVFSQSSSSGIDRYEVWSNAGGSSYGLISIVTSEDFAASMSIVDSSFNVAGTVSYRVIAIRNGIPSSAATASQAFTAPTLDVSNMVMLPQLNTYILEYDLPESRFLDHVEVYVDVHENSSSISRSNATLAYSGNRDAFTYNIGSSDMNKFHQFWVECVI